LEFMPSFPLCCEWLRILPNLVIQFLPEGVSVDHLIHNGSGAHTVSYSMDSSLCVHHVQNGSGAQSASYPMGTMRIKSADCKVHVCVVLKYRMHGTLPPCLHVMVLGTKVTLPVPLPLPVNVFFYDDIIIIPSSAAIYRLCPKYCTVVTMLCIL